MSACLPEARLHVCCMLPQLLPGLPLCMRGGCLGRDRGESSSAAGSAQAVECMYPDSAVLGGHERSSLGLVAVMRKIARGQDLCVGMLHRPAASELGSQRRYPPVYDVQLVHGAELPG